MNWHAESRPRRHSGAAVCPNAHNPHPMLRAVPDVPYVGPPRHHESPPDSLSLSLTVCPSGARAFMCAESRGGRCVLRRTSEETITVLCYDAQHAHACVSCIWSPHHAECTHAGRVSMVRELHVYGAAVSVHARDDQKFQHQGYGTMLMREAERIARCEHRSDRLAVISGVGTRYYYRKLGYELEEPYMVKALEAPPKRRRRRGSRQRDAG